MERTLTQYAAVVKHCRDLFSHKLKDYGCAWRILRLPSLTDQIFIKAQRLRNLENTGVQRVSDDRRGEYIGIFNYAAMALIQIQKGVAPQPDLNPEEALALYDAVVAEARALMERKNHDYGEAWRDMRLSSLTDLILQKLLRLKQIEANNGATTVSEGVEANYADMLNYAAFALIKMEETQE